MNEDSLNNEVECKILTENVADLYNKDELTAEEASKMLKTFKEDKDLTEDEKTAKKFYEYILKYGPKEKKMSNIEKIKKSMEEKRVKTVKERSGEWEKEEEKQKEKKRKLYDKIKQIIEDEGGIYEFITKNCKFKPVKYEDMNVPYKWEFDENKLDSRIKYKDLSVKEKMEMLKNNIKENIKKKIKEGMLEEIKENDLEEYINNIVDHELNYDKHHKQIIDKSILKSINYVIGIWNEDKSKFYRYPTLVHIENKKEGLELIKELKEKDKITGEGWVVERMTEELRKRFGVGIVDSGGNRYKDMEEYHKMITKVITEAAGINNE